MLVEFYGGAKKAPGTYFVNEVKDSDLSTRLIKFVFSDTQAYNLEFGNQYIRFYKDDATTGKGGAILETYKDISGIVVATGVITATSHGFSDGDTVYIDEITTTTELNGKRFIVDYINANTFTLTDIDGIPIDTTGYTAYGSGGGEVSRVYTLTSNVTYTTADLWNLQFAQTADILYITLGSSTDAPKGRPQKKLTRTGHTAWTLTDIDYSTGENRAPLMPANITTTKIKSSVDSGDAESDIVADAAIFDITHEGSIWHLDDGYIQITDVASGGLKTTAKGKVLYGGTLNNANTLSPDWAEAAWSGYRGYPRTVTISEGRLIYGYTYSQPQTTWGSATGAYDTFELGADDADGIEFAADTNQVEVINWLFPANEILVGTPSGVSSLGTGSETLALTATAGRMKKKVRDRTSSILPQAIGNNIFYWEKYNRILREYIYSLDQDNYIAGDATALSEHISESGIVDMDYQQSPLNILWCVRADGKLAVFTRQIEQKVSAWTLHDTNGFYESVAVIPKESYDEVWFIVRRKIGGVYRRYIEYMSAPEFTDQEDAFFVHSGLTLDNPKTITNITKANPVVVTCDNDFEEGDIVKIRGLVEREAGAIPEKTVDSMEYPTDALIQAAYPSSDITTDDVSVSYISNVGSQRLGDSLDLEYWNAEKFVFTTYVTITQATAYFNANVGTPSGQVTCRLETDNAGNPSGTLAHANATLTFTPTASANNTINWTDFIIPAGTYWLVFTCPAQSTGTGWAQAIGNIYNLWSKTTTNGGSTWSPLVFDLYCSISAGVKHLECYPETTIKTQGLYSLKGIALITNSLNDTLTRTIAVPLNWTDVQEITFDIRASRVGSNIKIGFHDTIGGTIVEYTPNILIVNEWQTETVDISAVSNADKGAIDSIIITILNADAQNIFYIDNMFTVAEAAETVGMTELNNNRYIVAPGVSGTEFHLHDLFNVDVDGTEFTPYDTGGEANKCANEVSGLNHLALQNVQVFADGEYHPDRTVSIDGVVTLDAYYAQISIGLGYTARLKSNDLEGSPGGITSQGKTKRVSAVSANIYKSLDYRIGTDTKMDDITVRDVSLAADKITPLFTGIKKIPFPSGWDTKKQIIIEQEKCLPLHVLSLVADMEIN